MNTGDAAMGDVEVERDEEDRGDAEVSSRNESQEGNDGGGV